MTIVPATIVVLERSKYLRSKFANIATTNQKRSRRIMLRVVRYSKAALNALINPITVSVGLGLVTRSFLYVTKTQLHPIIDNFAQILGSACVGTALFSIGLSMYGKTLLGEDWRESVFIVITKQVFFPSFIYGLLCLSEKIPFIGKYPAKYLSIAYLLTMLPPAQILNVISTEYNVATSQVSSSLVFGGLASFVTIYISFTCLSIPAKDLFTPLHWISNTHLVNSIRSVTTLMGVLSMLCCVWTILPSFFSNKYRNSTRRLIVALSVSQFVSSFSFFMLGHWPELTSIPTPWCKFQGFLLQFSALASHCWYFIIALHLFVMLVCAIKVPKVVEFGYHVLVWGYALTTAIVILVGRGYKSGGMAWCWIANPAEQFGFFYFPFMTFAFLAVSMMIILGCVLRYRSTHIFTTLPQSVVELRKQLIWKGITFAVLYVLIWMWGTIHRAQQLFDTEARRSSFVLFLLHSIFSSGQGIGTALVFSSGNEFLKEYSNFLEKVTNFWIRVWSKIRRACFGNASLSVVLSDPENNKGNNRHSIDSAAVYDSAEEDDADQEMVVITGPNAGSQYRRHHTGSVLQHATGSVILDQELLSSPMDAPTLSSTSFYSAPRVPGLGSLASMDYATDNSGEDSGHDSSTENTTTSNITIAGAAAARKKSYLWKDRRRFSSLRGGPFAVSNMHPQQQQQQPNDQQQ
eukprot:GEZU01026311.1.p1 GENE.GEZU01026311.1~~GEZU01026311.1.p1  ORF type:complete len:773 (-),score=104.03 GEZU01026311.1:31-2097(-)